MIEIKMRNPDTGQFEDCSVSTLSTPRKINDVEFDGSKDIFINEKEIVIQSEVPTDDGNKLWISGIEGTLPAPISVDWENVYNKPQWVNYMPTTVLNGMKGKILSVKQDESGYEYIDQVGTDTPSAANVTYDNPLYPNVKAALDELLYVPTTVSLSGGGLYEVGRLITSVNLSWSINKSIVYQSIDNGIGTIDPSLRTYNQTGQSITSNRPYTITVNDGKNNSTSTTTVAFQYKRYFGVTSSTTISDAEILTLSKEFSTSRVMNKTFNCSGGKYFWIIYPSSFGLATFKVGGLSFSDMILETRNITNDVGAVVPVNIYRVNNIQTGASINVEVL